MIKIKEKYRTRYSKLVLILFEVMMG